MKCGICFCLGNLMMALGATLGRSLLRSSTQLTATLLLMARLEPLSGILLVILVGLLRTSCASTHILLAATTVLAFVQTRANPTVYSSAVAAGLRSTHTLEISVADFMQHVLKSNCYLHLMLCSSMGLMLSRCILSTTSQGTLNFLNLSGRCSAASSDLLHCRSLARDTATSL